MSESAALGAWRRRAQHDAPRPRSPRLIGGAAVALACAVLGGRMLDGERPTAAAPPAAAGPPPCPVVATAPQDSTAPHADVDGDGCDETVSFADGVLTAGAVRMRVGGPGDQVALGHWTCGPVTVALLRPATGEVFRFDGWATTGTAVSAAALGRVEGAVTLSAAPRDGGRCDDVVVGRSAGPPVLLPERPVAG